MAPATSRDTRGRRDRGKDLENDQAVGSVAAEIIELRGDERDIAHQIFARATHKVTVRYLRKLTLTTKHYFVFRGRRLSIGHVGDADQINVTQECLCSEDKA